MEDALLLLNLKNDSLVRGNAIKKKEITLEEHLEWFIDRLDDPKIELWLIFEVGRFAGDIRIEGNEISIRIAKQFRGKGLGGRAVRKFSKKGQIAKIVNGNVASMRIFVENGFNFIDFKDGVYTLKK